jgi:hypothetical protein
LLCPNCHALTDSWKGRNRKSRLDSDSKSAKMVKQKVHKHGITSHSLIND